MKRCSIVLPDNLHKSIKICAAKYETTMNAWMIEAAERYLEHKLQELKGIDAE